jgi:hypothetical protein
VSLETIASRLVGWMTKLPKSEAYNLVNDAWTDVRNDRLWSFQLAEDSISTPNVINVGTFTTVQGTNTVTADATATTALTGITNPLITQRQFRITSGGIYNIIAASGSPLVLTLDRTYSDPTGTGQSYQVYQCYFPAPVPDFKRWLDWRDLTNGQWLSVYLTRREVNFGDPQRLYFTFPMFVLPFDTDQRQGSATFGNLMFELYPNPLSQVSYMRYWLRTGADLVNPSDTLPYPMTDKLILERSKVLAVRWSETNRDPSIPRGQGANYQFLHTAGEKDYLRELKLIGLKDRDLVDLFLTKLPGRGSEIVGRLPYYSTIAGRAYSGT